MSPTSKNGKICYIELPAEDVGRSAEFYSRVFGWNVRRRGDGATSFDDTTGEVSGAWAPGRPPAGDPGLLGLGPWVVVERGARVVVGSAGFLGRPREGALEVGFGVVPAHRNRGFASEAARALVEWGLRRNGVARIVARWRSGPLTLAALGPLSRLESFERLQARLAA